MNSKKTMLIVDDQIIMQEFLYSFFSDEFEVVCKEDGGAAMSWLKAFEFDAKSSLRLSR